MARAVEEVVRFSADGWLLDGRVATPVAADRAAVICHPHPQYGGSMDNNVVLAVRDALQAVGVATLRFNFRGVGASEGHYAGGQGEVNDARGAVAAVGERLGAVSIALIGYSFGAVVALLAGCATAEVARLAAIAPPIGMLDLSALAVCRRPKLFLVGERDAFCPLAALTEYVATLAEPKTLMRIPGADHFFFGHEAAIANTVAGFVTERSST